MEQIEKSIDSQDEISLVELASTLIDNWKIILLTPFIFAFAGAIFAFTQARTYTATTRFIAPQESSQSAILQQLGGLGGVLGGSGGGNNLYISVLESYPLLERVVDELNLREHYELTDSNPQKVAERAVQILHGATTIDRGTSGIVAISVVDRCPEMAKTISNAYIPNLREMLSTLALTSASQKRLFYEQQLESIRDKLTEAEIDLQKLQKETGIIRLDEQGRAVETAVSSLRAEISAREVQISARLEYMTPQHPEIQQLRAEIDGLQRQLSHLTRGGGTTDEFVATRSQVSEEGIEHIRRSRAIRYYESLFELIAKQYEMARIDEASEGPLLQILEEARLPLIPSGPKRKQIVVISFVLGLFASIFYVFFMEFTKVFISEYRENRKPLPKSN